MERGSTKHGPVLDGEMANEELQDAEPSAEDQPEVGVPGVEGGAPPGMTYEEVEQRSRLGRYIPRSSLPGDREELVLGARTLNAPDDVIAQLAGLPAEERFETVNEIWAALGHHNEEKRT
jgi:hypothetical protein